MAKQATNIRLFTAEQIPHPGANQQKAIMPDPGNKYSWKCPTNARGGMGTHGIDWDITSQAIHTLSKILIIFCRMVYSASSKNVARSHDYEKWTHSKILNKR